ncbi:MAG: hypothetical protein WA880_16680 [Ornithinimicrobium sp.]
MGFEVFEKGSAPVQTVPSVTIQKRGLISLNAAAHELLKQADAVKFLWDADERVMGMVKCDIEDPNGYPVRSTGPAAANGAPKRASKGKAVLVAGSMFTRFAGIDTSEARRWVPKLVGDMLTVDLKEGGQRVVSNRNKAKDAAERGAAAT